MTMRALISTKLDNLSQQFARKIPYKTNETWDTRIQENWILDLINMSYRQGQKSHPELDSGSRATKDPDQARDDGA